MFTEKSRILQQTIHQTKSSCVVWRHIPLIHTFKRSEKIKTENNFCQNEKKKNKVSCHSEDELFVCFLTRVMVRACRLLTSLDYRINSMFNQTAVIFPPQSDNKRTRWKCIESDSHFEIIIDQKIWFHLNNEMFCLSAMHFMISYNNIHSMIAIALKSIYRLKQQTKKKKNKKHFDSMIANQSSIIYGRIGR